MILDSDCLRALVFLMHTCLSACGRTAAGSWVVRKITPDAGREKEVLHERRNRRDEEQKAKKKQALIARQSQV